MSSSRPSDDDEKEGDTTFATVPDRCPVHHGEERFFDAEFCDGSPDNGLLAAVTYPCGCRLSVTNDEADALKELINGPLSPAFLAACLSLEPDDAVSVVGWLEEKDLATMVAREGTQVVAPTYRGMGAGHRWYFQDERQGPLLDGLKRLLDTEGEIREFVEMFLIPFMAFRIDRQLFRLIDALDSLTQEPLQRRGAKGCHESRTAREDAVPLPPLQAHVRTRCQKGDAEDARWRDRSLAFPPRKDG